MVVESDGMTADIVRSLVYREDVRIACDSDLTALEALFRQTCLKRCRKIQSSQSFDGRDFSFIFNGTVFSRALSGYQ